jgi:subtilisin family serine protease
MRSGCVHAPAGIAHTFGPLNGTSMATPIVSGAAAMTLSLLGATDGNYYKATQVSKLLVSSAPKQEPLSD